MADHRSAAGSRRQLVPAVSTLSIVAAIGFAAAGCSGSQGGTAPPAAPTSSAVALSSPEFSSAPAGPVPPATGSPSASAGSSAPAAGSAPSAPATASAATPATGAGAVNAVIRTCQQQSVTRPTQYTLACGDGATSLSGLRWSGWGTATATATGDYQTVVCTPSCAAGSEQSYPATVSLTGLSGGAYTEMSISAPKSSPPHLNYALGSAGPRIGEN